jgi:hypothetical protein
MLTLRASAKFLRVAPGVLTWLTAFGVIKPTREGKYCFYRKADLTAIRKRFDKARDAK